MSPRNSVTEIPPAPPDVALSHFTRLLAVETDCWDVHECLANDPGFVLLDVRGPEAYAAGHVAQAVNLPYRKITESRLAAWPADTLFVVYCSGPHCNGADKAAIRLARLGRPVKRMLGGIEGWKISGFPLVRSCVAVTT